MYQVNVSDPNIQYSGRVDNSGTGKVSFSFPGVSIKAKFNGSSINAVLKEYGQGNAGTTNYFYVIIDGGSPVKMPLSHSQTVYELATNLEEGEHTVELIKLTESQVGKVEFEGFQLETGKTLLPPDPLPNRKIEFIGNSITCGYGNEASIQDPNSHPNGFTSVNENNYKAWGSITARNLNAQYSCVAYSGRGLYMNNNGNTTNTMPLIYDRILADEASSQWDPSNYIPDVIVINLGTNDFSAEATFGASKTVDSTLFVNTYISFIEKLRSDYPNATIICAVGVMMSDWYPTDAKHWTRIQKYVTAVKNYMNTQGDPNVHYFKMDPQVAPYGEDWHPSEATHLSMATKLTQFINNLTPDPWNRCNEANINLGPDIYIPQQTFPLTLNSQTTSNQGVTYKWYKDGMEIPAANSPSYQIPSAANAAGTYKVVRDSSGCQFHDEITIYSSYPALRDGKIAAWEDNKKAAVALTFDDWTRGHYAIVVPELKKRDMVATFNITTTTISTDWSLIKIAAGNGNEMANHTKTHIYPEPSQYETEVLDAKNTIETNLSSANENYKVYTFAYPFGSYDNNLINYLKTTGHIGARGVTPPINYSYNFATTENDYYKIATIGMDNTVTISKFKGYIDNVIRGGGFLTYLYHSIYSDLVNDNSYAAIHQNNFNEQMDAVLSYGNQIWITTFSNAIKYHKEANCATLEEVQAPAGNKWVINLTDTLADNDTYNYPLTVMLKMNGENYNTVKQNGEPLDFITSNDTIMFRAVPDGGIITLEIAGIRIRGDITPQTIKNTETITLTCTATVTAEAPNTITSVSVDLSSIGGMKNTLMDLVGDNLYKATYSIPAGTDPGNKTIIITAADDNGNSQQVTRILAITDGSNIPPDKHAMISDCENGNLTNLGTPWYSFTDNGEGGASTIVPAQGETFNMTPGGADGTGYAVKVDFTLDKGSYIYDPFVGFGFNLNEPIGNTLIPYDLTGSTGISFYHKGNPVSIQIGLSSVTDYNNYSYSGIQVHEEWEKVTVFWNEFFQASWGAQVNFDPALVTQIQFQITPLSGSSGTIWIDQVQIEGIDLGLSTIPVTLQSNLQVNLSPDELSVDSKKQISRVSIVNTQGITESVKNIKDFTARLPISSLPEGIHLAIIQYSDNSSETIKFIKTR
jgi:peptidoglycan/xylan/chitin deacetylase (PgdA/CDA1 family)/lysophospholipase L1-like esterase